MNYDSRPEIRKFLQERGFGMSKRFGQNFLVVPKERERIVSVLEPQESDTVWEIGPGIGAMTESVRSRCRRMVLFEIDHGFADYLTELYGDMRNMRLVRGDFMHTWSQAYTQEWQPQLIFGNLPYSSAAAMIGTLLEAGGSYRKMVFTIQKEVAERMVAEPGSKQFSAFSLVCAYRSVCRRRFDIPAAAFYPVPAVTSSVVEIIPRQQTPWEDTSLFFPLVRALFSARRKTIANNLKRSRFRDMASPQVLERILEDAGIDANSRAERLSIDQVAHLAAYLAAYLERLR